MTGMTGITGITGMGRDDRDVAQCVDLTVRLWSTLKQGMCSPGVTFSVEKRRAKRFPVTAVQKKIRNLPKPNRNALLKVCNYIDFKCGNY